MRLRRHIPEFVDAALERAYRLATCERDVRFARSVLLIGNAVSIPFILTDYHLFGLSLPFAVCAASRLLWLAAGLGAWCALRGQPAPKTADRWMLLWLICLTAGTIVISATRSSTNVTALVVFQAIVFACYVVVPFRYYYRLACGISGSLAYLIAQSAVHAINPAHTVPTLLSVTVTNAVGALAAYQIESSRRQSFRRSLRLRDAKRNAEEANLAKSRFLAAASHDLRQPVHALGLFLGALRMQQLSAPARNIVEQMTESIDALAALFNALLDVSALDAKKVEPHFQSVAVAPLLDRLCREFTVQAQVKHLALKAYTRPLYAWSDPLLLERVLRNLLSNAVRYTDRGRIAVGCSRTGDSVKVRVLDTGRGVAPQEQTQIFEEFYSVNPDEGGLGLGLAIVKRLTALLRISLHLSSRPGEGSLFTLSVPAAAAPELPAVQADYARLGPGLVLVIDDDETVLAGTQTLLNSWNLETLAARSYAEMAARLADTRLTPNLMICDVHLGAGESGFRTVARLREAFEQPVPALLISGKATSEDMHRATESGCVLLQKPVSNAKLRAAVRALMHEPLAAAR